MRTVAENEGMVQICATSVNQPAFAVLGNPIAVNFASSDGTGKQHKKQELIIEYIYMCIDFMKHIIII